MEHVSPDSPLADPIPADAGLELDQALARLGNDHELLRDLARIYIEDAPRLLATTAAGANAADIEVAARGAHSLKGLAANFSTAAASAAHAVEEAIRSGDRTRINASLATFRIVNDRLIAALNRTVLRVES